MEMPMTGCCALCMECCRHRASRAHVVAMSVLSCMHGRFELFELDFGLLLDHRSMRETSHEPIDDFHRSCLPHCLSRRLTIFFQDEDFITRDDKQSMDPKTLLFFAFVYVAQDVGIFAISTTTRGYDPYRITYQSLLETSSESESALLKTLQQVGMVSITQIPQFKELRDKALSWDLHACSVATESSSARSNSYEDGTIRRTFATHAIPDGDAPKFRLKSESRHCNEFALAAESFRATVDHCTGAFASRLSTLIGIHRTESSSAMLLETQDNSLTISTFSDVVQYGEHLEHFHSYQKLQQPHTPSRWSNDEDNNHLSTIELHTDQGMFLVFAPGRVVHQDPRNISTLSVGFSIELQGGGLVEVDFDDSDDLVVLMGDGVNQYVNPFLSTDQALRAVPHTLSLPIHSEDESRVWYGRMVLPPPTAIHPLLGRTFRDLREELVMSTSYHSNLTSRPIMALGCSLDSLVARQLEETSCEADTLYCWHRCMRLADYNISNEICEAQGKEVFCVDSSGHLWDGSHGDFHPGCATNTTEIGGGTIMYMFGFRFFLDGERPFLNFFFVGWTLDSRAKFIGSIFAVFFMGILVEGIVKLRQKLVVKDRTKARSKRARIATGTLVHGWQELFGYLLMLTTMTYSIEFLFAAASGLAAGHALFAEIQHGTDEKNETDDSSNINSVAIE